MNNRKIIGHLLTLFTVIVWGTTFVSTKVLLQGFKPVEVLFLRFIIALIVLVAIYPQRLKIKERKREILFMGAGLCGVTLYFLLENIALTYTMASNASVIISTAPFFTAVLSHIVFKNSEKLHFNFFIGFVLAIVGICIISFSGNKFEINPIGDFLSVCAAVTWAFYSVITKKISDYGYNTIQVTRRIFVYGIIFMTPTLYFLGYSPDFSLLHNWVYTANILFLGILASAVCFITWNCGLKILGPVKTSVYIYAQPVITIIFSFIFLGERLTFVSVIGTILTLSGLVISERKQKKDC